MVHSEGIHAGGLGMKYAAGTCFALGLLVMIGLQTIVPDSFAVVGYLAMLILFAVGIYFSYDSEL